MKTLPATPLYSLVAIDAGSARLYGELEVPVGAKGLVVFAHGSGSSRHSPRNGFVARVLRKAGLGTLLFDLLTLDEEEEDLTSGALRFDIEFLADRLSGATRWLREQAEIRHLNIGYFGSSTGGGAALVAASDLGDQIGAVVSRGGRPDLAGHALESVQCPTLLIVGGLDGIVIRLNEEALEKLRCTKELQIIPGATHLFSEPGKLEEVAHASAAWFCEHLAGSGLKGS